MIERAVRTRRAVADAATEAVEMAAEDEQAAAELEGAAASSPAAVARRTRRDLGISLYTSGGILVELQRLTAAEQALRESLDVLLAADGAAATVPPHSRRPPPSRTSREACR